MKTHSSIESHIEKSLKDTMRVISMIGPVCGPSITKAIREIIKAFRSGKKLLICGNGGSAADSQHIAAEFVVRFQENRYGLPAIALTTDTSILTAASNDYGFEQVFAKQVEALGQSGDVFMGLSTSGLSRNIVYAMEKARSAGLITIALTGEKSGPLSQIADISIQIPDSVTARIQEGHIAVGHLICEIVEKRMFSDLKDNQSSH
jgi:D-sedoheptulose 7-phosphate isomerase